MKTAIVYISKHGTTQKVANQIAEKLKVPKENIFNLRENRDPDIGSFDRVIVGGSIHAGMIQKRVKDFCERNLTSLLMKETGLFMSAMNKDQFKEEFNNAFPEKLRDHSKAVAFSGGEFLFEKMNFLEKAIVKKVSKIDKTFSDINQEEIEKFAKIFQ